MRCLIFVERCVFLSAVSHTQMFCACLAESSHSPLSDSRPEGLPAIQTSQQLIIHLEGNNFSSLSLSCLLHQDTVLCLYDMLKFCSHAHAVQPIQICPTMHIIGLHFLSSHVREQEVSVEEEADTIQTLTHFLSFFFFVRAHRAAPGKIQPWAAADVAHTQIRLCDTHTHTHSVDDVWYVQYLMLTLSNSATLSS